jgi:hypothetical protein
MVCTEGSRFFSSPTRSVNLSCFEHSVVSGNASNNNVVRLYDPKIKAEIDAAVFRIAPKLLCTTLRDFVKLNC